MRTLRTTAMVTVPQLLMAVAGLVHPRRLTAASAGHWAGLHIALLPVFPLLVLGLLVPLRGSPGRDVEGGLTVLAWVGCLSYAAYYTGLDAVAGISAGTVAGTGVHGVVGRLFTTGDELGRAGVYALTFAALATSAVLLRRHGMRVLPGAVVVLCACWSFVDSHIFWPKGVLTMLGFAVGFGLLNLAATREGAAKPARASAAERLTNP